MKSQRLFTLITLITILLFSFYVYVKNRKDSHELSKEGVEIEAIIERYSVNHKGHCITFYSFEVNDNRIVSSTYLAPWSCKDTTHIGERYRVIYLPSNPHINEIYFDVR